MIMENFKEKASTQYGDYKGYFSMDGHGGGFLHKLCKEKGIDSKYFPVAFEIQEYSPGENVPYSADTELIIYAIDKNDGGQDFDAIAQSIRQNDGITKVTKIGISLSYAELSKYIKRLGIFAMQNGMDKVIQGFEEVD